MDSIYYKITSVISRVLFLCGIVEFVIFIWSIADETILTNEIAALIHRTISITDIPTPLFIFSSAAYMLTLGLLGMNIKKGTGIVGVALILDGIMIFAKLCDLLSLLASGSIFAPRGIFTIISIFVFILFFYSAAKQWSADTDPDK